jgi:hypothetical protein
MNKIFDLSKLTTSELLAVKNALVGQVATGSKAGDEARKLRIRNAELEREKHVRDFVLSVGLDFDGDPDFFLDLDKAGVLEPICQKMCAEQRKATALAGNNNLKIPPCFSNGEEPTGFEFVRDYLKRRKSGGE